MFSFNLARTLRALGLAAVVVSPLAAGTAFADGYDGLGPSAYPAWSQAQTRTMLASPQANQTNTPAQNFLVRSGATGGDGQHS